MPSANCAGLELMSEIALFAFLSIFGIVVGSYALSKVGQSRSIPVNLGLAIIFFLGAAIGGFCGMIAIMGSV